MLKPLKSTTHLAPIEWYEETATTSAAISTHLGFSHNEVANFRNAVATATATATAAYGNLPRACAETTELFPSLWPLCCHPALRGWKALSFSRSLTMELINLVIKRVCGVRVCVCVCVD